MALLGASHLDTSERSLYASLLASFDLPHTILNPAAGGILEKSDNVSIFFSYSKSANSEMTDSVRNIGKVQNKPGTSYGT